MHLLEISIFSLNNASIFRNYFSPICTRHVTIISVPCHILKSHLKSALLCGRSNLSSAQSRREKIFKTYDFFKSHYGITGYGVSSPGDTKLERLLHKNQHTQMKLLNLDNWTNSLQKSEFLKLIISFF